MVIKTVGKRELEKILPLVAEYQRFYRLKPDEARNRVFFGRFARGVDRKGKQFVALDEQRRAVGFATLYFLPSSLSARTYCVLNDLYTVPAARGTGVGRALIAHCSRYAGERGHGSLEWQTERSNRAAQGLYDQLGALRSEWLTYSLPLSGDA